MTVRIAPLARADLREIYRYSFQRWGRARAQAYIADLRNFMQTVAATPALDRPVGFADKPYRRADRQSHAVIFLRANPDAIDVLRVLHVSRDIVNLL